jgi:hypothetical protein
MATNAKGERGGLEKDRAGARQHFISEIKCLRSLESLKGNVERPSEALVNEGKTVCTAVHKDIELLGVPGGFR